LQAARLAAGQSQPVDRRARERAAVAAASHAPLPALS
jgi:hypothetical protein